MSKIYAVAMDSFSKGVSIRNSYTVARGPFEDKEIAERESAEAVIELQELYNSMASATRSFKICDTEDNTHFLMMNDNGQWFPIARYTVFEIDSNLVTAYKSTGIKGYFKKGTAEQMAYKKRLKKVNQYIASLKPITPTEQDIQMLVKQ